MRVPNCLGSGINIAVAPFNIPNRSTSRSLTYGVTVWYRELKTLILNICYLHLWIKYDFDYDYNYDYVDLCGEISWLISIKLYAYPIIYVLVL